MKKTFWSALILTFFLPLAASATDNYHATTHLGKYPDYPTIDYQQYSPEQAAKIKRGEYLAKIGDCIACHTTPGSKKVFAGGLAIKTPFGTIYTPNITSDKTTGIGNWSEKDFIKAMRDGISPQGHYYYPAFPYIYFNIVKTDDLKAMKAYFDAVPAIRLQNKKNDLVFPFSWRFLQLGWRILFFDNQGRYQYNKKESAAWNRGKYIVNGLGHCSMCHTPMHHFIFKKWVLGAPVKKYYLTGNLVDGFFAPNITATSLENTPTQAIADVFLKDKLIGGGNVLGPMQEVNHDSLEYLDFADIRAIADYLKTVKSEIPPRPKASSDTSKQGKNIYSQYCAGCHATGAGGAPIIGNTKDWGPLIKQGLNTLYKNAINGIGGMPAKGTCGSCSNQDIQVAVQYIVSKSKPGATTIPSKAPKGKRFRKLSADDGKAIYERYCAFCHNGANPEAPKLGDTAAWDKLSKKGFDVLVINSIKGYNNMPPRGGCAKCNDAQIKAAVKYMLQQSTTKGDYRLW